MPEDPTMLNPYRAAVDVAPWQPVWRRRLAPKFRLRDLLLSIALFAAGTACLLSAPPLSEEFLALCFPGGAMLGAAVFALYRRPLLGAVLGFGLPLYGCVAFWTGVIVYLLAVRGGLY